MFCAKCGKEIDNDSTFCPYCGQKTDAPVENSGSMKKPRVSVKMPGKKMIGGIAAVVVVLLVAFGISKVIGGIRNSNKSLAEKLFTMSWEDMHKLSEDELKDMLGEAGTLYNIESEEESFMGVRGIKTKTTESFMGGDCLYMHSPESFMTLYETRYGTEEEFKEGKKQIEETLKQSMLKKTDVWEGISDGVKMQFYLVDASDKYVDEYLEAAGGSLFGDEWAEVLNRRDQLNEEEQKEFDEQMNQLSIYKMAFVGFGTPDDFSNTSAEFVFPADKSYTNYICVFGIRYIPMREADVISMLATNAGYDAISGKKIDIEKFEGSVDEKLVNTYLDGYASDDAEYRRELKESVYIKLYMMENHKFDTGLRTYLKTDDEKRLWYVRNFEWDTNTDAKIDLSNYRDSTSIYCAVECNYNSSTAEYFESELDKALYLADRDYKLGSGESFRGTDEKRFWFMQNYSYDTSSKKTIDKEIVDALIAYQKYIDQDDEDYKNEYYGGYNLIYIDEDNVPELLATGSYEAAGHKLISYHNGKISENYIGRLGGIRYAEKNNFYCNSNGNTGSYYDVFYKLVEGEQTELALGENREKYDKEGNHVFDESGDFAMEYFWNGAECGSEEEYYNVINDFVRSTVGEVEFQSGYFNERYFNILKAYDALRTTTYDILAFEFTEFSLSEGVLTFSSDGAVRYGSENEESFSYSFPIAKNCQWGHYNVGDEFPYEGSSYEDMKEWIEDDMKEYREQFEKWGDIDWDSPLGYCITVIDDEIVDVRSVSS